MATRLIELEDGILVEIEIPEDQVEQISGGVIEKVRDATVDRIKPLLVSVCKPVISAWNELNKDMQIDQAEIQLGLSFILGWVAILLFVENLILGIIAISIIIILINNKKVPSAILLMFIGFFIIFFTGAVNMSDIRFEFPVFTFYIPNWEDLLIGMLIAGIAQLFLTLTNVMIATVNLAKDLFPEKEDAIDANSLALNMGALNLEIS